jgi:hypothetical protein
MTPPDSDAREVRVKSHADKEAALLRIDAMIQSGAKNGTPMGDEVLRLVAAVSKWDRDNAPPPPVSLPLTLAQRILAALEATGNGVALERLGARALAAELRALVPK